ncbi:putative protein TPRXL [Myripristis murdjan]|uniref:putative protein TPRXL n=1 Tax=Myripristis murdjan TaxID=586833 RepID=UPI0011763534|nr:putative protein TPRXL [Myripristis murdjan]
MKIEINLVFCALVVLTGSLQTKGQSTPVPPVLTSAALPSQTGTPVSPVLPEDAGDKVLQWAHTPSGWGRASTKPMTITEAEGIVQSMTMTAAVHGNKLVTTTSGVSTSQRIPMTVNPLQPTASVSDVSGSHSALPTAESSTSAGQITTPAGTAPTAGDPHTTSTFHSTPESHKATSTTSQPSTQPQSESLTPAPTPPSATSSPLTSAPAYIPAGPTHHEIPSELNVGDEDLKGSHHHPSSPLDPLLAGLLSVLIVTTAIISVILFLRFHQRADHPEFHRLQDLPMDDLMEDTPLSRYTY